MADQTEAAIVQNESYSVRQFSPNSWGGFVGDSMGYIWGNKADMLPAWGTPECDIALRLLHYRQHGSLVSGAAELYIEKFLSIPFEISGGRNLTFTWQDLFFDSEFGEGYDVLIGKGLVDYLTLNRGWFMEVVSYGDPDTPIKEGAKILGINHLDAMRIYFTGNREWPYLYASEWGGALHKLHYTRVIHIARQPSPNTLMFGMGKSALYDTLTVANSQIMLGRHQNELLNDLPPPGIVIFNNVKPEEVKTAMTQFDYARVQDGQNVYRAPLSLSSKDPNQPATVTFVPMSTVPENFNYKEYMDIHVNLTALNFGLDPQDLWPLTGGLGSGSQSKVLAVKTDVKGPGYLSKRLTPVFNKLMPRSMEWKYKAANPEQDKQSADIAAVWSTIADASTFMNADEKRQLVANQVPAFADVLLDEQGQIRVFDDDQKEPQQVIIATGTAPVAAPATPTTAPDAPITADGNTQIDTANANANDITAGSDVQVAKAIDATNDAFIQEMTAIIQDGLDKVVTKAGCAARIRGAINRYGKAAYIDGLADGCVSASDYDESDALRVSDIAVYDTQYVTDLVNEIYSEAGMTGTPESRAPKWMGTTDKFYYAGIESADKNAMFSFEGDDGKESCPDCQRLKGQKHRMSWWVSKELRPGVDHSSFECGGWQCQHYLERVGSC